uniref:cell division protein FtsQ/DivIB n=1 Tax=Georgenia sp. SYP-B2076 TaxID=2495881 RepID=UPI00197ABA6C
SGRTCPRRTTTSSSPSSGRSRTPAAPEAPAGLAAPRGGAAASVPPGASRRRAAPTVSSGLSARRAERNAAERRLLRRRVALAVGVVGLLTAAAWVLLVSPLLALQEDKIDVTVTGTTVDPAAVHDVLVSAVGTPLLRVGPAGLVDRLEGITEVKEAQVSRAWPNGLAVTVVAREPVAAAATADGWVLIDPAGVQVGTVAEVPEGLPVVTVPLETSEATAPALAAVLTVLGTLPEDLLAQVAEAGATTPGQVTLRLHDGATVRWGSASENELKAAVLGVLRQQPAQVYDVTVPRTPTTA